MQKENLFIDLPQICNLSYSAKVVSWSKGENFNDVTNQHYIFSLSENCTFLIVAFLGSTELAFIVRHSGLEGQKKTINLDGTTTLNAFYADTEKNHGSTFRHSVVVLSRKFVLLRFEVFFSKDAITAAHTLRVCWLNR